jgi:hypothetical protein
LPLDARAACRAAGKRNGGLPGMVTSREYQLEGKLMNSLKLMGIALAAAVCLALPAMAQVVPDTLDPYELAPQNIHLYPVSINARLPYYSLPPIFAPAPMWRGAIDAEMMRQMAPHNYIAREIPESTALVAWGTMKGEKQIVMEAANQQEFIILPPEAVDDGSSFMIVRTSMRYVPRMNDKELNQLLEHELMLEPSRVDSIAESLPVDVLLNNYDRVDDIADINPRVHPFLQDEIASNAWPVERIYLNYSGWRRNQNRIRSLGGYIPEWFTCEGKLLALKKYEGGDYLLTVEFEGYNPWWPLEFSKNVMRKMIGLSFNQFAENVNYYDVELPLEGKEWYRQGSGRMEPYHTRTRWGTGSPGQGNY